MSDDEELKSGESVELPESPPPAEECPPCKAGAPSWMATFADMATLLMAFFVLLLSFAEVNVPKFKQVAGVARVVPRISLPTATSLVKQEFTPSLAEPTVLDQKRQRSEDITRQFVIKKTEEGTGDFKSKDEFRRVQEALAEQIEQGAVTVRLEDDKVVVELQTDKTSGGENKSANGGAGGPISQATLDVAAKIVDLQTKVSTEIEVRKQAVASGAKTGGMESDKDSVESSGGSAAKLKQDVDDQYQQIRVALAADIQMGLAEVERDGDRIVVRLASQGSFISGSADLQPGFGGLLSRVGNSLSGTRSKVRVELITVAGFADTRPIDTNNTAAGRSRNRRIEVIVDGS